MPWWARLHQQQNLRNQVRERSRKSLKQKDQPLPLGPAEFHTAYINAVQESCVRVGWWEGTLANQWRCAEGEWISQEENAKASTSSGPFRCSTKRKRFSSASCLTLYALAINMVVKSTEVDCHRPLTKSGVLTNQSLYGWPDGDDSISSWQQVDFSPYQHWQKSQSTAWENSLTAAWRHSSYPKNLWWSWRSLIDKSGLPGHFKVWIYQHAILSKVLWPWLGYNVPMSTVEILEKKISSYLQRWLGLPRSLSNAVQFPL